VCGQTFAEEPPPRRIQKRGVAAFTDVADGLEAGAAEADPSCARGGPVGPVLSGRRRHDGGRLRRTRSHADGCNQVEVGGRGVRRRVPSDVSGGLADRTGSWQASEAFGGASPGLRPGNIVADRMRDLVLDGPGPPGVLDVVELPILRPQPALALAKVRAFWLNRSEITCSQAWPRGFDLRSFPASRQLERSTSTPPVHYWGRGPLP
jgi:hypothetical protein